METKLFGYPATLVLADKFGEFEVMDGFKVDSTVAWPILDTRRIYAAVSAREKAMYRPQGKRPAY